jgi:hypothetical protein
MTIQLISTLSLHPSAPKGEEPQGELLRNGQHTGKHVPGSVLEAAIKCQDCYLLFVTDDIPHEEMLRVLLLDAQLNIVDYALIGAMYSTGAFTGLQIVAADTVKFRFIGGADWHIDLLHKAAFRIPFISEPRGVSRPFGFSRRFIVRGNPQPQR